MVRLKQKSKTAKCVPFCFSIRSNYTMDETLHRSRKPKRKLIIGTTYMLTFGLLFSENHMKIIQL